MTIKNILLFILLFLPSFLSANSEINDIYIADREPITSPIPEYNPDSNSYPTPFNDDQIILTIDKDNYINFVENILTPGQIEMFEAYPETFKMHVYPSRRSCAVPPEVLKLTKENAKLTDEGEGLEGVVGSIPFPNPSEALHHVWNHILRSVSYTHLTLPTKRIV